MFNFKTIHNENQKVILKYFNFSESVNEVFKKKYIPAHVHSIFQ